MTTAAQDVIFRYRGGRVLDTRMAKVIFEPGIQRIDESAFQLCSRLETVNIPPSVQWIGRRAFSGCRSLKSIFIPDGVAVIPDETFMNCESLHTIGLPNSIREIGDDVFHGCPARRIDIPREVTKIGQRAFCFSAIEAFVLPNRMEKIPERALSNCSSLKTVKLHALVKEIGPLAFSECYCLEYFVIPNNGLPLLKVLNFRGAMLSEEHGWKLISQIIRNAPNLEYLAVTDVIFKSAGNTSRSRPMKIRRLSNNIERVFDVVLAEAFCHCPRLSGIELSLNTQRETFEFLASRHQDIPDQIRDLAIKFHGKAVKDASTIAHFLRFLENKPKLSIWTNQFWEASDDKIIRHHLELSRFGCRGFILSVSVWPAAITKLVQMDTVAKYRITTGAPNILYQLLRRHPGLFEQISQRGEHGCVIANNRRI